MEALIQTDRLALRELARDDAAFILKLVNEPSWLRFIGDKGIRTLDAAASYIVEGPMRMYARHGFGLWLVLSRDGGVPLGICGLIKRDSLENVDLGFAFLPHHWRNGFALESAAATLSYAWDIVGLKRIVAIVSPDNDRSVHLLDKLGFRYEKRIALDGADEVSLYAIDAR